MGGRRKSRDYVTHVVRNILDGQGAQHALREGEMRAIDAPVALCMSRCEHQVHTYGW